MLNAPKECVVPQGWPLFLLGRVAIILGIGMLFFVSRGKISVIIIGLIGFGIMLSVFYCKGAGDLVRINCMGFSCWAESPGRKIEFVSVNWRDIEACARNNQNGQRILRIFFRQPPVLGDTSSASPIVRRFSSFTGTLGLPGVGHIDINFALAYRPEVTLEQAFQSCAEWVVATRGHASSGPAVRDFVDLERSDVGRGMG